MAVNETPLSGESEEKIYSLLFNRSHEVGKEIGMYIKQDIL
jgi:hypothetical protein